MTAGNATGNVAGMESATIPDTRPWDTPQLPPLVGSKEAVKILGVTKMTLGRWLEPGSGTLGPDRTYMIPPERIDASPVWVRADVERFAQSVGRQRKLPKS